MKKQTALHKNVKCMLMIMNAPIEGPDFSSRKTKNSDMSPDAIDVFRNEAGTTNWYKKR